MPNKTKTITETQILKTQAEKFVGLSLPDKKENIEYDLLALAIETDNRELFNKLIKIKMPKVMPIQPIYVDKNNEAVFFGLLKQGNPETLKEIFNHKISKVVTEDLYLHHEKIAKTLLDTAIEKDHSKLLKHLMHDKDNSISNALLDLVERKRKENHDKAHFSKVPLTKEEEQENKKLLELNRLIKKTQLIKEAGHILGLRATLFCEDGETFVPVECEGITDLKGIHFFLEYLKAYEAEFKAPSKINTYWKTIVESFNEAAKHNAQMLHQRYHQDKLTIIQTGWQGHSIVVALYKDYLVYCNRGRTLISTNLGIYKIFDRKKVTLQYIEKLSNNIYGNYTLSMGQILSLIQGADSLVISSTPICSFNVKDQKVGNCVLANAKTLIRGLLYLLEQEFISSLSAGKDKKDEKEKAESTEMLSQIQDNAFEISRREYKRFTQFMRDRLINKIFAEIDNKENNEQDRATYIELLEQFLAKDLSRSGKKAEDWARKQRIMDFLNARNIPFKMPTPMAIPKENGPISFLKMLWDSSVVIRSGSESDMPAAAKSSRFSQGKGLDKDIEYCQKNGRRHLLNVHTA